MKLTKEELEELALIKEYLEHSSSEIARLGYSLYKSKYEHKFKDIIKGIYTLRPLFNPNCLRYRCEYLSRYWNEYHNCALSYAIDCIINYGFD